MPTAGNVTPALPLGWASAVCLADDLECLALVWALDLGEDVADAAGPELEDGAVP